MAGGAAQNSSGQKTFVAGGTIRAFRRVVMAADGTVTEALVGASGGWIGVAQDNAASGDRVSVRLLNHGGTFKTVTAGAVTAGAAVYGAAAGCIDDASSGSALGQALEAATAAGDIIEWCPLAAP